MKDEGPDLRSTLAARLGRGRRRWALVAALVLALGLGAFALFGRSASAQSGLAEARRLWAANGITGYTLKIAQETRLGSCDQEMVTSGGETTAVSNTCGMPATWTVPRLFSWIEELEREEANCYPDPSMCACMGEITTAVSYDPAMGYPREVIYEWRKRPNLLNAAYYRSLFDRSFPGCDKDGRGGPVVYTVTLTEQP